MVFQEEEGEEEGRTENVVAQEQDPADVRRVQGGGGGGLKRGCACVCGGWVGVIGVYHSGLVNTTAVCFLTKFTVGKWVQSLQNVNITTSVSMRSINL